MRFHTWVSAFFILFSMNYTSNALATKPYRGELLSSQPLQVLDAATTQYILSAVGLEAKQAINAVQLYKIRYRTVDVDGQLVQASAQVAFPMISGPFTLLCYHHGTATHRGCIPTSLIYESGLFHAGYFSGTGDFYTVQPDYLGLGDNPGKIHPYLQPDTLASASVDAIFAAQALAKKLKIPLHEKIVLSGYSEGGLATLATLQNIERHHPTLNVAATAAGAGPYLFYESVSAALTQPGPTAVLFAAYFLYAFHVTHGVWPDLKTVFNAPYDTLIPSLFDGQHDYEPILEALPATPRELLTTEFFEDLLEFKAPHIDQIAHQFNFHHWRPRTPVLLAGPGLDLDVPFFNSEILYDIWQRKGVNVTLQNVGETLGHIEGKFKTAEAQLEYLKQHL